MKLIEGWRKMDKDRGFINTTSGQTLTIKKKEFGRNYVVFLLPEERKEDEQGKIISPEYPTEAKAEAFAIDWMKKNTKGAE